MKIKIRKPHASDHEQWLELWRGYQAFYEMDLREDEDWLWSVLLNPPGEGPFALVAEDDGGDLAGLTHYLFHISTKSQRPRCYLNDLFTAKSARGHGVGRALIEAVYEKADEAGALEVYWLTQDFNTTARGLYDKVANLTPFIKYSRQGAESRR